MGFSNSDSNSKINKKHCGYIALIGRPNVGKSTLLNKILNTKLSIISKKAETTQRKVLGIKTMDKIQAIFVDTPGINQRGITKLNRYMHKIALQAIHDVDVILFMIKALQWTEEDQYVLKMLEGVESPVILVINQVDKVKDKDKLLPFIEEVNKFYNFAEVFPISAQKMSDLSALEDCIYKLLPEIPVDQEFYFPAEYTDNHSDKLLAAELIREKLLQYLNEEVPYAAAVEINEFKLENNLLRISGVIWVERQGQKAIIIGSKGSQLKVIAEKARLDMEKVFKTKVFLRVWVRVKTDWRDDPEALVKLGYQ